MPPHEGAGDLVDWDEAETALGVPLPGDFRDFLTVYGVGTIDNRLEIASLEAGESDRVDIPAMTRHASGDRGTEESGARRPLRPEPGSLIGWGRLKSYGDTYGLLYWRMDGPDPDLWPVVVRKHGVEGFTEHPRGMADFLGRLLQDAGSLPWDQRDVFGAPHSRFVHRREEERLNAEGIDPWEYLDDLYEELDDPDEDVAVEITSPSGETTVYRRGEVPADIAADLARMREHLTVPDNGELRPAVGLPTPVAAIPNLTFLGLGFRDGTLEITASIALGSPDSGPLQLSAPLQVSVRISGPQGGPGEQVATVETSSTTGRIEVTRERPHTFSVKVPASGSLWEGGRLMSDLATGAGGASVVLSVTDDGVGAFRRAVGVTVTPGAENILRASWPPQV
ncbi:SMI1/KNR4 family protein [Kitasatospora sp. A2-31]|uniref:SMI1/KNR4 family protein n=1 Tax=Kitasatospora sp. A2-31 TaxID=2916414 RepID=UPI001EEEE5AF|nr:SMI1/KNR4 family protein [Kitasatospora sp. A2-31]MCG6499900.1 SMI1/KNR4 family protein [Kitasatospora sp. A2-31]